MHQLRSSITHLIALKVLTGIQNTDEAFLKGICTADTFQLFIMDTSSQALVQMNSRKKRISFNALFSIFTANVAQTIHRHVT
jgi:hypothetical protein